jgi:hypothetical protein
LLLDLLALPGRNPLVGQGDHFTQRLACKHAQMLTQKFTKTGRTS